MAVIALQAQTITVTDIVGRQVTIKASAERISPQGVDACGGVQAVSTAAAAPPRRRRVRRRTRTLPGAKPRGSCEDLGHMIGRRAVVAGAPRSTAGPDRARGSR